MTLYDLIIMSTTLTQYPHGKGKGDHHISFLILSGVSAREITLLFGDAAFDEAKKSSKHLQQTPWCLSSLDAIVGYRMELRRIDVKAGLGRLFPQTKTRPGLYTWQTERTAYESMRVYQFFQKKTDPPVLFSKTIEQINKMVVSNIMSLIKSP